MDSNLESIFENVIDYQNLEPEDLDPEHNYIISFEDPAAFTVKIFKEILALKNYEFINILDDNLFQFFKLETVRGIIFLNNREEDDCVLLNKENDSDIFFLVNDKLLKRRIFDLHLREKNQSLEFYNYILLVIVLPLLFFVMIGVYFSN